MAKLRCQNNSYYKNIAYSQNMIVTGFSCKCWLPVKMKSCHAPRKWGACVQWKLQNLWYEMTHLTSSGNRCLYSMFERRERKKGTCIRGAFRVLVHVGSWGNKACKAQKEGAAIADKNKMDFLFTSPHLHEQEVMQVDRGTFTQLNLLLLPSVPSQSQRYWAGDS